jgi:hypothetical protein
MQIRERNMEEDYIKEPEKIDQNPLKRPKNLSEEFELKIKQYEIKR